MGGIEFRDDLKIVEEGVIGIRSGVKLLVRDLPHIETDLQGGLQVRGVDDITHLVHDKSFAPVLGSEISKRTA